MSFLDVVWFILISFAFIAYLMVMFSIIADIFRDRDIGGAGKALWIVGLIILPFITALIYLVTHGDGMAERSGRDMQAARAAQESYIKQVAGTASPVDQISTAKALLDAGAITPAEFESLKARAMA